MLRSFALALCVVAGSASAQPAPTPPQTLTLEEFRKHPPMAEVLLLGTFHFKDAGRDGYKPEVDIDIRSEQRQRELAQIVEELATRFRPTKVAIEASDDWAQRIVETEYPGYLADAFELGSNEVYQLGFRVARRMGHDSIHPVDADGRAYESLPSDGEAYARARGQSHLLKSPWDERFTALYRGEDRAKAARPLVDTLLAMNRPERLLAGHGHYLLAGMALGDADEYPGADHVTGWWYNRNLRIFANIRRIAEPGDRILVLIGAGHVPILRHALQASPEFRLVEVSAVLDAD